MEDEAPLSIAEDEEPLSMMEEDSLAINEDKDSLAIKEDKDSLSIKEDKTSLSIKEDKASLSIKEDEASLSIKEDEASMSIMEDEASLSIKEEEDYMSITEDEKPKVRRRKYKCSECGHQFVKRKELTDHMKVHPDAKMHICDTCGKGFYDKEYLSRHLKTHTKETLFICEVCGMSLSDRGSFRRHMQRHEGERNYVCEVCKKAFVTNSNLAVHRKVHATKSYFCAHCDMKFQFRGSLRKHTARLHTIEKLGLFFSLNEDGSLTLQKKIIGNDKSFVCNPCKEGFTDRTLFKTHISEHELLKSFRCLLCNKDYETEIELDWHIQHHAGIEVYTCIICNKKFWEKNCLAKHMEIHWNENCPELQGSGEKGKMKYHNSSKEKKSQNFKCSQCLQNFREKSQLERHLRYHSMNSSFVCGFCGWSSPRKEVLDDHIKEHQKEPVPSDDKESMVLERQCNACERTFAYGCHHECKGKHSFSTKCNECSEEFGDQSLLDDHMKYHDKARPFVCGYCGWRFVRKCNLTKHTKWHKKVEDETSVLAGEDLESAKDNTVVKPAVQNRVCNDCGEEFPRGLDHICGDFQAAVFTCNECLSTFPDQILLDSHMRYHDKSRLFACYLCGWRFARKCNLQRHMNWHMKSFDVTRGAKNGGDYNVNAHVECLLDESTPNGDKEPVAVDKIKKEKDEIVSPELNCETEMTTDDPKKDASNGSTSTVDVALGCHKNNKVPVMNVEPTTEMDCRTDPVL